MVTWYILHQGEDPPIHSECLLHHGSARDARHVLIVYAGVMFLVLPIKWSLFFAGNVIGLALFFAGDVISLTLPTNLLLMDWIKPGGGRRFCFSFYETHFSSSEDCFS